MREHAMPSRLAERAEETRARGEGRAPRALTASARGSGAPPTCSETLPHGAHAQDRLGLAVIVPAVGGDGPQSTRDEARSYLEAVLAERFELARTPNGEALRGCANGACTAAVRQASAAQLAVGLTVWSEAGGETREVVVTFEDAEHRYHGTARLDGGTLEAAVREATRQAVARMQLGAGPFLFVDGTPPEAVVHVDGELQGGLPWRGVITSGAHEVRVSARGYREHVEQVNVPNDPGEEVSLRVDLEPTEGAIEGETQPDLVANLLIAGGLAVGGVVLLAVHPLPTLARLGECELMGPGGLCAESVSFDAGAGVVFGLGAALVVAGVVIAIAQPITVAVSASPQSAHLQLQGTF